MTYAECALRTGSPDELPEDLPISARYPQITDLASLVPLVVIGAGRAALHIVSRLPIALHE
eukprot:3263417-Pyramimonas_sp.AAC.1